MKKMKKIMENWQRAVTEHTEERLTPEQIEQIEQIVQVVRSALGQMDSLPESLFDEVGEDGSPARSLFEAYSRAYAAINELSIALDDSIIAQDGE